MYLQAGFDDRTAELQASLAKAEAELLVEREKLRRMHQNQEDLQNHACATDAHAQTLQIQLHELEVSNSSPF